MFLSVSLRIKHLHRFVKEAASASSSAARFLTNQALSEFDIIRHNFRFPIYRNSQHEAASASSSAIHRCAALTLGTVLAIHACTHALRTATHPAHRHTNTPLERTTRLATPFKPLHLSKGTGSSLYTAQRATVRSSGMVFI